jgi:hypothetical protein
VVSASALTKSLTDFSLLPVAYPLPDDAFLPSPAVFAESFFLVAIILSLLFF